jgi:hypothetical protein
VGRLKNPLAREYQIRDLAAENPITTPAMLKLRTNI